MQYKRLAAGGTNELVTNNQPTSVTLLDPRPSFPSPARERERVTDSLNNNNNNNIIPTGVIYISIHQSGYRHFINDLGRQKAPVFCCRDVWLSGGTSGDGEGEDLLAPRTTDQRLEDRAGLEELRDDWNEAAMPEICLAWSGLEFDITCRGQEREEGPAGQTD